MAKPSKKLTNTVSFFYGHREMAATHQTSELLENYGDIAEELYRGFDYAKFSDRKETSWQVRAAWSAISLIICRQEFIYH